MNLHQNIYLFFVSEGKQETLPKVSKKKKLVTSANWYSLFGRRRRRWCVTSFACLGLTNPVLVMINVLNRYFRYPVIVISVNQVRTGPSHSSYRLMRE